MGFPRQEYWSWLPILSPGDLPNPGIELTSSMSPALQAGFFTTEPAGEPTSLGIPALRCFPEAKGRVQEEALMVRVLASLSASRVTTGTQESWLPNLASS